ncbi:hypothetical protein HYG81_18810 [Natrinema zhouii]|uniref:hypothetical protein n=1 Tax=Natrinema zhouii TaxID=1710539 RepID=UPI001CF79F59|nr:hypothetical protein [Natrinema zhouii]UHQ97910.1 hypothetical protein HYG81_18810 [Natrinema zhouii]
MNGTREAILDCLGTLPDRPDPAVETVSSTSADRFERRLLEYDIESAGSSPATVLSVTPKRDSARSPSSMRSNPSHRLKD